MKKRSGIAIIVLCTLCCSFILSKKQNIAVVFIGDSITAGSKTENYWPGKFAGEYLSRQPELGKVLVANMGKSGFTTVNFLPGHKTFNEVKAAADSINKGGSTELVFSIMLGTNDSAIKGPAGSPVAAPDYRANMKQITDSLLIIYPRCKIVINHPIWYSDNTQNYSAAYLKEGQARVLLYENEIDTLVAIYQRANEKRVFKGDTKAYDYFKENYLTDFNHQTGPSGLYFLHPNAKGDTALGEFWAKAILSTLK